MKPQVENPKDAIGSRKLSLAVLPWRVLHRVALGMLEGALKYGRHNYRAAGVRASVYFDAVQRHLGDWWEGNDLDPDSNNLNHIDKAITALFVLRDSMLEGNWIDDRPPRSANPDEYAELNKMAAALIDKYAHVKPRHYTIKDTPAANEGQGVESPREAFATGGIITCVTPTLVGERFAAAAVVHGNFTNDERMQAQLREQAGG